MSTISSGTTSTTTLIHSGDTTGSLVFKTNDTGSGGTTAVTINTSQAIGVGSSPSYGTSGQVLTSSGSGSAPTWTTVSTSAATPTALGTVVGQTTVNASPYTTALGYQAASGNTSGTNITAIGYQSGASATAGPNTFVGSASGGGVSSGTNNVAVGWRNLGYGGAGTTGGYNVCVGDQTFFNITTGQRSTAVGYQAGYSQVSADSNTFVGHTAGYGVTGNYNTAIGRVALNAACTADNNTAVGYAALNLNTSGSHNTAIGWNAFSVNTTGTGGVAIGYQALASNTTPSYNIAIGYQAVSSGNGGNVTAVGYQAGINSAIDNAAYFGYTAGNNAATGGNGAVAIGPYTRFGSTSPINEVVLGVNAGGTVVGKGNSSFFVQAGGGGVYNQPNTSTWNTTSDRRLKKNIVDNTDGLNKITNIRVRNFEYRLSEEIDGLPPEQAIQKSGVQLGVIAQELQEVLPECVTELSTGVLSVQADNLTWYFVNAIKDLKAINDQQAQTITALTARIEALENK